MRGILILALLATASLQAESRWSRAWKYSLGALAASHAADVASSWGAMEGNSLARSANGRFDPRRGIALKAGLFIGIAVSQRIVLKRWPEAHKPFALANVGMAATTAAVAGRNWRIR